jgi:membrane protein
MSIGTEQTGSLISTLRAAVERGRTWLEATLVWQVWERMVETEFVDRSVALAGKAFVSFFPLVIVVAAFVPAGMRASIFQTLTTRLGVQGPALALARKGFSSADDIKRATGFLGLFLTFFFASSFTTALQRVYLRAWRRPRDLKVGSYTRGLIWLAGLLLFMTLTGAVGRRLADGMGLIVFVPLTLVLSIGWWWFSAWYLLLGHVRWRVLLPSAVLSSVGLIGYGIVAQFWMPDVVTQNLAQFGFFGIALALVTWFSGASVCIIVAACAGPVLAEDDGVIGRFVRGQDDTVLNPGVPPALPAPERVGRWRDVLARGDGVDDLDT